MVKTLKRLTETCQGDGRGYCPILEDLAHAAAAPLAGRPATLEGCAARMTEAKEAKVADLAAHAALTEGSARLRGILRTQWGN